MNGRILGCLCGIGLAVTGCRIDPGTPDYSSHVGLVDNMDVDTELLPGPDPYVPGEDRLSVGLFYEGGLSEEISINGTTTNYFIFVIEATSELTYEQEAVGDRIEGLLADKITLVGTPFWGGGIIWFEPINLSDWDTLHVSFKSDSPSFETFEITLQSGEGDPSGFALDPTAYGWVNDGEWHSLDIPLQDAIDLGFDPSLTRAPFIVGSAGGESGDTLLLDNLYFSKN